MKGYNCMVPGPGVEYMGLAGHLRGLAASTGKVRVGCQEGGIYGKAQKR